MDRLNEAWYKETIENENAETEYRAIAHGEIAYAIDADGVRYAFPTEAERDKWLGNNPGSEATEDPWPSSFQEKKKIETHVKSRGKDICVRKDEKGPFHPYDHP